MNTLLISYDLIGRESISAYEKLHEHIKAFPGWAKPLESVWLIQSNKSASKIRDELQALVDPNDKILVLDVSHVAWGSFGISKEVSEWMHKYL